MAKSTDRLSDRLNRDLAAPFSGDDTFNPNLEQPTSSRAYLSYPENYLRDRRRASLESLIEERDRLKRMIDARNKISDAEQTNRLASLTPDLVVEAAKYQEQLADIERSIRNLQERKGFATLADDFRASLVDTQRMGYPLHVLERDVRRRADESCRNLIPVLHRAHRMVLDDDYTRLASELARGSTPATLARLLDVARLPFPNLWIEWSQPERYAATIATNYQKDSDIPPRVGVLISPAPRSDRIFQLIPVSGYVDSCGPGPVGIIFSLTEPIEDFSAAYRIRYEDTTDHTRTTDNKLFIDECAIGYNYMEGVRKKYPEQVPLAERLSKYAWISIAQPLGPLHRETIINAIAEKNTEVADRQQEWLGVCAREINGLWRFLVAVLALYQTGGGEFVVSQTKKQPRRLFRSGTLPAYEYRILKLSRPTRPEIVHQKLPPGPGTGSRHRFHTVPGAWHHRRLATAECARHPKPCPVAVWNKKIDPDTGEGKGSDQYECTICHRIKWFVPKHNRGDKKLGIVDKGYLITSSKDDKHVPPSHETVEVVQSLPPGVRIKSIPRFDEPRHGEESHEHQGGRRNPLPE